MPIKKPHRYAAALLTLGGKVLLGKRSLTRKKYPGIWDILGGHCEKNETFEVAMIRELKEETGVTAKTYQLMRMVEEPGEFIMAVYHITDWEGEVFNAEPSEHELLEWKDLDDAIQLDFPDPAYIELLKECRTL